MSSEYYGEDPSAIWAQEASQLPAPAQYNYPAAPAGNFFTALALNLQAEAERARELLAAEQARRAAASQYFNQAASGALAGTVTGRAAESLPGFSFFSAAKAQAQATQRFFLPQIGADASYFDTSKREAGPSLPGIVRSVAREIGSAAQETWKQPIGNLPGAPSYSDVYHVAATPSDKLGAYIRAHPPKKGSVLDRLGINPTEPFATAVQAVTRPEVVAGGALAGGGLAANLLGRGSLTVPQYFAMIGAGSAAASTAGELGAPMEVQLVAALAGGVGPLGVPAAARAARVALADAATVQRLATALGQTRDEVTAGLRRLATEEGGAVRLPGKGAPDDLTLKTQIQEINAAGGKLRVIKAPERLADQGEFMITGRDALGRNTRIQTTAAAMRNSDLTFLKGESDILGAPVRPPVTAPVRGAQPPQPPAGVVGAARAEVEAASEAVTRARRAAAPFRASGDKAGLAKAQQAIEAANARLAAAREAAGMEPLKTPVMGGSFSAPKGPQRALGKVAEGKPASVLPGLKDTAGMTAAEIRAASPGALGRTTTAALRVTAREMGLDATGTPAKLIERINRAKSVAGELPVEKVVQTKANRLTGRMGEGPRVRGRAEKTLAAEDAAKIADSVAPTTDITPIKLEDIFTPQELEDAAKSMKVPPPGGWGTNGPPPKWVSDAGLPPEVGDALSLYIARRRAVLKGIKSDTGIKRKIGSAITGDIPDPFLAELLNSEIELQPFLRQLAEPAEGGRGFLATRIKGPKLVEEGMSDAELLTQVRHIQSNFRNMMLRERFPDGVGLSAARDILKANDIERMAGGLTSKWYDEINGALRSVVLGLDVAGAVGQQGLRAVRGAPAVSSGILGRLVPSIRKSLYETGDIDFVAQSMADGLQMGGRHTADITGRNLIDRLPYLGDATNNVAELQFGRGLGSVRLRAYEGLLLQNKALNKLTFGKLGGDITKASVRRHIAEFANTIGSTARGATGARRSALEGRSALSTRMTRAQVNEVLTPLRSLRSQEDMINTVNLIAGTAALFAGAHELNDKLGVGDLIMDPTETMFGKLTLDAENAKGEKIVVDFLPQASLFRTIMKTVDGYQNEEWTKILEAWGKFGVGRTSVAVSDALGGGAGVGYGRNGEFFWGGMPLNQRIEKLIPGPLAAKQSVLQGDISLSGIDLESTLLGQTGFNAYGESGSAERNRTAGTLFNDEFVNLYPDQQVQAIQKILKEGGSVTPADRVKPYTWAENGAFNYLKDQIEQGNQPELGPDGAWLSKYDTIWDARDAFYQLASIRTLDRKEREAAWEKFKDKTGINKMQRSAQEGVIRADPEIYTYLKQLYDNGETDWKPAKWAQELAEATKAGATP